MIWESGLAVGDTWSRLWLRRLRDLVFIPEKDKTHFVIPRHSDRLWDQPTFNPVGTGSSSLGGKVAEGDINYSPVSCAEIEFIELHHHSPICLHDVMKIYR
jgi:hypothetical protein